MKKILTAVFLTAAMLLCACDGNGEAGGERVTAVEMTEIQSVEIDAANYAMSDIEGVTKLSDSGVIYAFCTNAENANATLSSLNQLLDAGLREYDTENKDLVLILVTLGEGEKSDYDIEKIEMTDGASLNVYVKTNAASSEARETGEYHFVRLGIPVCGKINVYLDGEQMGE